MRRPRDFDSELKALNEKAKALQESKLRQLGELVRATRADALPIEVLAGALIAAAEGADMIRREEWRTRGAAFFRKGGRGSRGGAAAGSGAAAETGGAAAPAAGGAGAK